jgi:hypothetical protein
MNTIDITSVSDRVLEAFLAFKSDDTSFNFDELSRRELVELQGLLPTVDFSVWILLQGQKEDREHAARKVLVGQDYESAILARQERAENF